MKSERKSNIELLRIMLILMIVAFHYVECCVMRTDFSDAYIVWNSALISNKLFTSLLAAGGDVGVGAFFLITGYFLSSRTSQLHLSTIIQMYFYGVINALAFAVLHVIGDNTFSIATILKQVVFPVTSSPWWFATVYIVIVLAHTQLNKAIEWVDGKNRFLALIALLWIVWYIIGKILNVDYYRFIQGFFYYFVGAYISRHGSVKKSISVITFVATLILYSLSTYVIGTIVGGQLDMPLVLNAVKALRRGIIGPVCAISVFCLTLNTEVKQSRLINSLSKRTFGVYLFHAAPCMTVLMWYHLFSFTNTRLNSPLYPLYALAIISVVYVLGVLVDSLRGFCEARLTRSVSGQKG